MITVFIVSYYYKNHNTVSEHTFESFEKACMVVAETWAFEKDKVFTIVDNRDKGDLNG